MYFLSLLLFSFLTKSWCFTPNCMPENQFKFYDFPIEACSENFQQKCKFHARGYFKSLGSAPLVKIQNTAVIPTCAFFKADDLRIIYGVSRQIKVLATGSFMNLPNLEAIHLAFNHIEEVRKDTFKNISAELLDLSWNKITFIDSQAFSEIRNLKYLNLSRNVLVTVPINSLSRTLVSLNLAYNLLSRVALNSNKFQKLAHVDLSYNDIVKIAIYFGYPVESIDLTHNKLQNFDYLDIHSVKLFKMGKNLFESMPQYMESLNANDIDIYPNPWRCEELISLWKTLTSFSIRLIPKENTFTYECQTGDLRNQVKTTRNLDYCFDDHDCPTSMICRTHKCWDPCEASSCHNSSICEGKNHEFTCSCPSGFLVNPLDINAECKKVECYTNTHCPDDSECWEQKCIISPAENGSPFFKKIDIVPAKKESNIPWWYEDIPMELWGVVWI